MNKKIAAGFGVVAVSAVGLGYALLTPDEQSSNIPQSEGIETISPQAGDVDGPHEMVSTEAYLQLPVVVGPFSDASTCQQYMNSHIRSVQAGIDNPAMASNPIKLAVAAETVTVSDTTRSMFKCRPAG